MTDLLSRFLKITKRIKSSGNMDELFKFLQSLDATQARDLMNDIYSHSVSVDEAIKVCDVILTMLRKPVAKDVIRETMQFAADMGFGTLEYDKDGNIDAINIKPEQGERMNTYYNYNN